jgi:hypothetical protein
MSLGALLVLLLVAGTLPALVRQLYPPLPLRREDEAVPRCVVVLGGGLVGRGKSAPAPLWSACAGWPERWMSRAGATCHC